MDLLFLQVFALISNLSCQALEDVNLPLLVVFAIIWPRADGSADVDAQSLLEPN